MNELIKKMAAILTLSGLGLAGAVSFAAEFEILDRFSVDGYSVLRGSADIPGGLFTVGASTFVVKDGKVGIGTTAPVGALTVEADSSAAGQVYLSDSRAYSSSPYAAMFYRAKVNTAGTYYTFAGIYGGKENAADGNMAGYLALRTRGADNSFTDRLRIDNTGNVGIGTAVPASILTIWKQDDSHYAGTAANVSALTLFNPTNAGNVGSQINFSAGSQSATNRIGAAIGAGVTSSDTNGVSSYLTFATRNAVADAELAERMRIANSGNVGIGTTSPVQKLDVNVTTNFDGIRIGGGAQAPSVKWITNNAGGNNWAISTNKQALGDFAVSNAPYGNDPTDPVASLVISSTGNVGIGTANPAVKFHIAGTDAIIIPVGTTGQRPASGVDGMLRVNTSTGKLEYYNGGWNSVGAVVAAGGTMSYPAGYRVHTFTTGGTFTVTTGGNVEILVVAGGGGGAGDYGGGGGAGGLIYYASYSVTPQAYTVTVGAGGGGSTGSSIRGNNGFNSVFNSLTAVGGGGGGAEGNSAGKDGGSGGGSSYSAGAGSPTPGQGSAGGSNLNATPYYAAAGGGGAGAAGAAGSGATGGAGGAGLPYSISGATVYYAGGGGGGGEQTITAGGAGGTGGGGRGSNGGSGGAGVAGTDNTGGGGGGGSGDYGIGAAGGSGIVIIRYSN